MAERQYSAEEATLVLHALAAVAAADGAIRDREEMLLEGFALRYRVRVPAPTDAVLDEAALAHAFPEHEQRRQVLVLCLEMAHVDGDYHPSERALIERIARAFGISDAELAELTSATT
jgi:tellurite resistance protein